MAAQPTPRPGGAPRTPYPDPPLRGRRRHRRAPGEKKAAELEEQRELLLDRVQRSRQLIETIDRTIAELKGNDQMTDSDLYKGFSPEKQAEYEAWLVDRYGASMREQIDESMAGLRAIGPQGQQDRMAELATIETELADAMRTGTTAEDPAIESTLLRHRLWVGSMWNRPCAATSYAGLADLYLAHPDFRSRYEAIAPGFTDWLVAAMRAHAARH